MSRAWEHQTINLHSWRKQRIRILKRDNYVCQIQGPKCTKVATQAHHLVPWAPNQNVPDSQLQAVCQPCNAQVGSPEKFNPAIERPNWLSR